MHQLRWERVQEWALLVLVVLILIAWPIGSAYAQNVNAGEIRGSVTDSTGAALPGVIVSIVNLNTGVRVEAVTNSAGVYDVLSLTPGRYQLTFTKEGFSRQVRQGIDLQVQVLAVNAELTVGATSQSVEVTGEASLLRTENSEQGATLQAAVIKELPNVNQNWLNFTRTLPGVTGSQEGVSVNGGQRFQGNWLSDGGLVVIPRSQNLDSPVIFESIAEVKITTSTFDAQYGSGTAVFNQITKSGTNQFHGSLYEYAQNSAFNARSYFARNVAHQRRHQYGGSVGGPIIRDKAFFYFNYDTTINRSSNPGFSTRPTAAMKAGDFSDPIFRTIYDPDTLANVNGQMVRQPFPNNRIPLSRMDPVALNIQEYIPTANVPGLFANNFYFEPLNISKPYMYLIKGDYALSNNNRLNASFMRRKQVVTPDARFNAAFPLDTNAGNTGGMQGQLSDVWTVNATTINEFRSSIVRQAIRNTPSTLGQGFPSLLGIQYALADVFPSVTIGGPVGGNSVGPGTSAVLGATSYVTGDTVTMIKGRHIIKVGGQWEASQDNGGNWGDVSSAAFTFNPVFTTRAPGDTQSGLGYADFLTGKVSAWSAFISPSVGVRMKTGQMFVQDDIKLRPNFTLNIGMRYEIQGGWSEVADRIAAFDPTLNNPATNTLGAMWFGGDNGRRTLQNTKHTILPRIGFAWTPSQKLSFRGGYGTFSHRWGTDTYAAPAVRSTTGFFVTGSMTQTDNTNPVFQLSDPNPPLNTFYPDPAKRTPASVNGQPVQYFPFDTPVSRLHEWSFSIQRELPIGMVAEAAYVGSKGSKLYFPRDLNQVPQNLLGPGNAQARRPYPQYQAINGALFDGQSSYNSMQLQLRKRFAAGVSFDMNYTWSKNLNHYDASGHAGNTGTNYYQNAYDRDVHWGISNNDIPHAFKTNFVAQLPFGRGRRFLDSNGWLDAALGGWQLSGILIRQSGVPFTPIMSGANGSQSLAGTWFPNRIGNGNLDNPTLDRWFDTSAFVAPAAYTYGNSGRNILRGPKLFTFDASMGKTLNLAGIREGMELQLRVDANNILNHASFGLPNNQIGAAAVGVINSTAVGGRQLQLGARFAF